MSGSSVSASTAIPALLVAQNGGKHTSPMPLSQNVEARNIVIDQQSVRAEVLLDSKWQKVELKLTELPKELPKSALPLVIDKAKLTPNAKGEVLIQSPQNSIALRDQVILLKLLEVGVNKQSLGHINTPFNQVSLPVQVVNQGASPFIEIKQMNAQLALPQQHKHLFESGNSAATLILKVVKGQLSAFLSLANQAPIAVAIDSQKLSQWLTQQPIELKVQPGNNSQQAILSALIPSKVSTSTASTSTATKTGDFTALSQLPISANLVKQIPAKGVPATLANSPAAQPSIHFSAPPIALKVDVSATATPAHAQPVQTATTAVQSTTSIIAKIVSQIKAWQKPNQVELPQQVASQPLAAAKARPMLAPLLPMLTKLESPQWNQWQALPTVPLQQPNAHSIPTDTIMQRAPLLALFKQMQWLNTTTLGSVQNATTGPISQQLQQPMLAKLSNAVQLTDQLNLLQNKAQAVEPPLRELVNQAFARMIGATQGTQHTALSLQAQLQPWQISQAQYLSTFNGHMDVLNTALFAQQTTGMQTSTHAPTTPLVQVLQLLLGKSASTQNAMQQLQSQLQSAQASALLPELQQISQQTLAQHATPAQSQQDNNPFVQFFVPMKLPAEAGQTQLRISQQKAKQAQGEHSTSVWLIEMQFDYPKLGTLSAQAQLGDKSLVCELKATSSSLVQLAQQHTHQLQQKLQNHGLKVAGIKVEQISEKQMALQQQRSSQHSIINIRV